MIPEKKVKDTVKEHREQQKKRVENKGKILMLEADEDSEDSQHMLLDLKNHSPETKITESMTDMKNILGYLNQGEWTSKLSIGSIM